MAQPGHPVVQLDPLAGGFLCGEEVPVDRMRRLREQTGILRLRCFRVVAVLAQRGGFGLVGLGEIEDSTDRATFVAYLVSLPVIPISTVLLTIKEKTVWAMGSLAVGAFAVAVMTVRLQQIWNLNA